MKNLTLLLAVAAALVGCASSSGDVAATPAKPGEGQAQNPSGKPQTPEAQALDQKMSAAGQTAEAGRGRDAQAMADAMRKAGGK